jgi:hypothetical protein
MRQIRFFVAAITCLAAAAMASAQLRERSDDPVFRQRGDYPPSWSIGNWVGRNEYRHNTVELQIGDDGKCVLTYRVGSNVQTSRGNFRDGRLEFQGDRYSIRQSGSDMTLQKDNVRADYALLHRVGRPNPRDYGREELSLDSPRNNDVVRTRSVVFEGTSSMRQIEIEIFRGREKVAANRIGVNRNRFEARFNLDPGRYEAVVQGRDRGRNEIEKRIAFTVRSGEGRTFIDRPAASERVDGTFTISGTSEADEVEVEIYRGRDRVFIERVPVRNDRFTTKASLGWGDYVLTVRGKDGSRTLGTDRRGFEVFGRPDDNLGGLRIDSPSNNGRYRDSVEFNGTTGAREVRIEIYRGRDRVANQTVTVRDGRFRTRIQLGEGRYRATVSTMGRGNALTQRDINFEVSR